MIRNLWPNFMGLFLRKKHLLRCWGWLSLLNWIGALTLSLLLKLPLRKLEPWFVLWSFFLLRLICISINLPYGHVWNTAVMSGLVLLIATWNCWISYRNGYVGILELSEIWNSLPIEWFPLTYDLSGFKSRINRHLLTVGSF